MSRSLVRSIILAIVLSIIIIGPAGSVEPTLNEIALEQLKGIEVDGDGFTFVVWGDSRDDLGRFDDVIAKINEIDPAFSIGLGDYISNGRRAEYDAFVPRLEALNQPLISIPGNHDFIGNGERLWNEIFGKTNFAFDFGGVRFVCTDNADYVLCDYNLTFLRDNLDTDMPRMVFMHCPPNYGRWSVHCFTKGSDELLDILEEYEVDYAFFAHIHLYDEMMIGSTRAIVTGGAGAPLYKNYYFGGINIHVVKVTVTPGGITHEYVRVYD